LVNFSGKFEIFAVKTAFFSQFWLFFGTIEVKKQRPGSRRGSYGLAKTQGNYKLR